MPRKTIPVRYEQDQLELVAREAQIAGMSISDFVGGAGFFRAVLAYSRREPEDAAKLLDLFGLTTDILKDLGPLSDVRRDGDAP